MSLLETVNPVFQMAYSGGVTGIGPFGTDIPCMMSAGGLLETQSGKARFRLGWNVVLEVPPFQAALRTLGYPWVMPCLAESGQWNGVASDGTHICTYDCSSHHVQRRQQLPEGWIRRIVVGALDPSQHHQSVIYP